MFKRLIFFTIFVNIYLAVENAELTVYNQNLGLIKETREISLSSGINEIKLTDVTKQIDPTSVYLKTLESIVLEQNYEYDLISDTKLLEKAINQKITLVSKDDKFYEGILLSFTEVLSGTLVLLENGKVTIVYRDNIKHIKLGEISLITQPTLVWKIKANKKSKQLCELSYLTQGIKWETNYILVVSNDDKKVDFKAWVNIDNNTGVTFKNTKLKLIAGDIHCIKEIYKYGGGNRAMLMSTIEEKSSSFKGKSFFEYYSYDLDRKIDLKDRQMKQIKLLSSNDILAKKVYICDDLGEKGNAQIKMEFENSKKNNLGIALPEGKIRVYKNDEFIGEDLIKHTSIDDMLKIYIGDAFDIKYESQQISYKKISERIYTKTQQITLKNFKKENIEIKVIDHLDYADWEIIETNYNYVKKDIQTIEFTVPVEKNNETKIVYTIRYMY